jgi:hypothetical protein
LGEGEPTPGPSEEGNFGERKPTPGPSKEGNFGEGEPTPGPSKEGNLDVLRSPFVGGEPPPKIPSWEGQGWVLHLPSCFVGEEVNENNASWNANNNDSGV